MPLAARCWPACWRASALDAFLALQSALRAGAAMLAAYLVARRWWPRYAVRRRCWRSASRSPRAAAGCSAARSTGASPCRCSSRPSSAGRRRSSLALPLFVVTMASQNLPGVAAIRAAGYDMPVSKIITHDRRRDAGCWRRSAPSRSTSRDHRGDLHGPRGARGPGAALRRRRSADGAIYCVIGLFGAAVTGAAHRVPARAGGRHRRPGAARHHRRRPGRRGARRAAPRGGADHLPGHAERAHAWRHRLGVLGRGGRRDRALCATVADPAPRREPPLETSP